MKKTISKVLICDNPYNALNNSNLAVVCTEWDEFKLLNWRGFSIT